MRWFIGILVLLVLIWMLSGCGVHRQPISATTYKTYLMAEVLPHEASGMVTFYDADTSIGSGILAAGYATLEVQLTAGDHSLSAVFTSSDPGYGDSSSAVIVYNPQYHPAPNFVTFHVLT